MGIFATTTQTAPTVTDVVNRIKMANTQLYRGILQQVQGIFKMIWANPSFTPKQIVDGFGTDAVTLFGLFDQLQTMLTSVDPTYVPMTVPSQYVVTPNADGTITISDAVLTS